jgi:uncharacterized protein (UPF0548 family)
MFSITKPSADTIRRLIKKSSSEGFSYSKIGASAVRPPSGYIVDHNRVRIGTGDHEFEKALDAIRNWKMFDLPWIELCWPDAAIEPGISVGVLARHLGFFSLHPAQIVYVIDEPTKFGFAYGTLAGHGESGEERFLVELDPTTDSVFYEILAFSRPGHLLTRLGYPYVRRLQKRFAADSIAAMRRAISA